MIFLHYTENNVQNSKGQNSSNKDFRRNIAGYGIHKYFKHYRSCKRGEDTGNYLTEHRPVNLTVVFTVFQPEHIETVFCVLPKGIFGLFFFFQGAHLPSRELYHKMHLKSKNVHERYLFVHERSKWEHNFRCKDIFFILTVDISRIFCGN